MATEAGRGPSGGGALRISAVVVHYRTPELAARAVEALATDARGSDLELEILLVDNGSDQADREGLRALPARYLDAGVNRGYAGGVNLGFAEATGDVLLAMNPDVLVLPGCLAALAHVLAGGKDRAGVAVAGPRFYWDEKRAFLLPPAEERVFVAELLAVLARRGGAWARPGRRRWRRHARRHWLATEPVASHALSGALLAIRRDAWQRVGPFDEKYRLYFEETDWLERARRLGLAACYVPTAEAVHLYAQSTEREPRAEAWFEQSARRFRRRRYGPFATAVLETLARLVPARAFDSLSEDAVAIEKGGDEDLWLEVAASPAGYPAAACRLGAGTDVEELAASLPEEIRSCLPEWRYLLRLAQNKSPSPLA